MTEQLLQFIWQFRYFNNAELKTTAGETLQIIHPGTHNHNQGPDFLNARVKCGDTLLAGNVEIHVHASEWDAHGHSRDSNYKNLILHVVWREDKKLEFSFPTLELEERLSSVMLNKYDQLMRAQQFIACEEHLPGIDNFILTAWKERLLTERLQDRATVIHTMLEKNDHHWEECFWQLLARNFGIKINSDAFERIARALPVKLLAKHRSQLLQLEALLMGQAGLLEKEFNEDYPIMLQKEYRFLKKKYALPDTVIPVHFLRMRPANFPTLRLSQLAFLVYRSDNLFSKIKEAETVKDVLQLFNVSANDYWHYHYSFDEPSPFKEKKLGMQMARNIILNSVIPMLYAYGWYNNTEAYKLKAIGWAGLLDPEKNNITEGFEKLGIENKNAADSQALIQLKNKYCDMKRCLECAVGNRILKLCNMIEMLM